MGYQTAEAMVVRKGYSVEQLRECLDEYTDLDVLQVRAVGVVRVQRTVVATRALVPYHASTILLYSSRTLRASGRNWRLWFSSVRAKRGRTRVVRCGQFVGFFYSTGCMCFALFLPDLMPYLPGSAASFRQVLLLASVMRQVQK